MTYLVDGYNLLFTREIKGKTLQFARQYVIELINEIAQQRSCTILLIFDGKQEKGLGFSRKYFDSIEIIYTADGSSADEFILEYLSFLQNPKTHTVVSCDRKLCEKASHGRASYMDIETFLEKKNKKALFEKPQEDPKWYRERLEKAFEERLKKEE